MGEVTGDGGANAYSDLWFSTFLSSYPQEFTEAEVAFLVRQLPLPDFRNVLDVCCGAGRHALPLAALGYRVTGVDLNESMLAETRRRTVGDATFVRWDMRDLASLPGVYDAVINMWQSFGYFDPETNLAVLRGMKDKLRVGGRLVLDVNNGDFYEGKDGERTIERGGRQLTERSRLQGNRQVVELDYMDGKRDLFSWQAFTASEISLLAKECGLESRLICAWFDESKPVTPETQRMQIVFERTR